MFEKLAENKYFPPSWKEVPISFHVVGEREHVRALPGRGGQRREALRPRGWAARLRARVRPRPAVRRKHLSKNAQAVLVKPEVLAEHSSDFLVILEGMIMLLHGVAMVLNCRTRRSQF